MKILWENLTLNMKENEDNEESSIDKEIKTKIDNEKSRYISLKRYNEFRIKQFFVRRKVSIRHHK